MQTKSEIESRLKSLKPILERDFFVKTLGYFGSYSREEQTKDSDLDVLVSFNKTLGWEFFRLKNFLEENLELSVDLVSDKALYTPLGRSILDSVIYV